MKKILIINGSGGVGKDTFVDLMARHAKVIHTSIVNPTKELARKIGWNGGKTEKDRKFLSDMKILIDEYNDENYSQMRKIMKDFTEGRLDAEILCIDMREKEQIERAKKEFGASTVLVTRASVPHIVSNMADKGVFDIEYDYQIKNDGSLFELNEKARDFVGMLRDEKPKGTIYVSYPCNEMNAGEKIKKIINMMRKSLPGFLFVSPVFAFCRSNDNPDIRENLWLLSKCDKMIVFNDRSNTCKAEIEYCKKNNIPYQILEWKKA